MCKVPNEEDTGFGVGMTLHYSRPGAQVWGEDTIIPPYSFDLVVK